ncbi:MAG TPA: hypothetical protein VEG27_10280 [Usitatibacter sp.]|nr:hypothetical protein [Usitatibacter sp.]
MDGTTDFAQARIQSRHGAHPDGAAWAMVHAAVNLSALLEAARASALRPWIAGLDAGSTLDEIERLVRVRLRGRIEEVARWMPQAWRPAVLLTRELVDLPARQRLAAGLGVLPWMADDPALAARPARDDVASADNPREAWLAAWRASWPRCSAEERAALEELVSTLRSHLAEFARASVEDAWELRRALGARLERLFRRHALLAAAAFDHLALLALDAERLRAELVAHAAARRPSP